MQPIGLVKIRYILGGIFLFILVAYTLFVFWNYLKGPTLDVTFPHDGYSTTSPTVEIFGTASHINYITLNDRPMYVDEKGNFRELLLIYPGTSIIKLQAKDRYDRAIERIIRLERTSPFIKENTKENKIETATTTNQE